MDMVRMLEAQPRQRDTFESVMLGHIRGHGCRAGRPTPRFRTIQVCPKDLPPGPRLG
jgi:hypothetical protein